MYLRLLTTLLLLSLANLSHATSDNAAPTNIDPYENYNRHAYKFNDGLDRAVFKPVAKAYKAVLPHQARKGVTNFFNNIAEPETIANELLQGKFLYAVGDTWRFFFNTTIGVGGLFDVASHMGLPRHQEDFGLTLAKWGYQSSTYIVLPIWGPSTIRDGISLPINYYSLPYSYLDDVSLRNTLQGVYVINTRAGYLNFDHTAALAFDPYVFQRNAYLQHRNYLMNAEQNADDDTDD